MKAKLLIILAVIIGLIAFFYPKNAGGTCGWCLGPPSIERTEYACIGFKSEYQPNCMDCGRVILCYGIVTPEKKCYTYLQGFNGLPTEVPNCKQPTTWQEILSICPNCYSQAAGAATNTNETSKAVELCNNLPADQVENCLSGISSTYIYRKEFVKAESFCFQYLHQLLPSCLTQIANEIAKVNLNDGLSMCGKISQQYGKDLCYQNLAMIARDTNTTRALGICDLIKDESIRTSSCTELIKNYCTIYPGSTNC